MCGIAGFLSFDSSARQPLVQAMCDRMVHRGPDDEGFYSDRDCAIGMRRLSIIDLARGHQPISNEDGSIWIVFNGEVYNYQSLRDDLIAQGHVFKTASDTETLIHLYEQEGTEGLKKLRGMYAYAIWDTRRQRLLLVRDRFGKKPLYVARRKNGIYFASEMKCLFAAGIEPEMDAEALRLYLSFGYIPDPWSAIKGVEKIPGGTWISFRSNGTEERGRYWSVPRPLPESEQPSISREDAKREMIRLFDESVRLRMIADVPLGAFLSGGIDSTLVVASMAMQSSAPVKTYSIGFDDEELSELPYARATAERYGTDHHEHVCKSSDVTLLEKLVDYLDEPFADPSAIPTYLVSHFTAQHVKCALSGDGGDEFYGGYISFFDTQRFRTYDNIPRPVRGLMSAASHLVPHSAKGKNFLNMVSRPNSLERYFEYGLMTTRIQREMALNSGYQMDLNEPLLREIFGDGILPQGSDPLSEAMHFEAAVKLTGDILVKVDRMSMANSLEVRCPLLDHVWAEFANTLPHSWKLGEGKGKLILKEAFLDRIPEKILNKRKQGFGIPIHEWFRKDLRSFVRDHLQSQAFLELGIVNKQGLETLFAEHESGRRDNSWFFWLLLILKLWHSRYVGAPVAAGV